MNDPAAPLREYDYRKSLKDAHRYPFLEFFRVERFLTRPLASLVVKAVFRSRIMPDHLTWASFIAGLLAAAVFLGGSQAHFIAGGVLALLMSILDCADGMLARARGQCTERGAFLDLILDRIADFTVMTALAYGTFLALGSHALTALALTAIALNFLQTTLSYLLLIYRRDRTMGNQAELRGFGIFVLSVFCVLNRPHYSFYALFAEALVGIVYLLACFFRPARP